MFKIVFFSSWHFLRPLLRSFGGVLPLLATITITMFFVINFNGPLIAEPWKAPDSLHSVTLDVQYGELRKIHFTPKNIFGVKQHEAHHHHHHQYTGQSLYPFDMILSFYERHITVLNASSCRYHPTCSGYTKESLQKHGLFLGLMMGAERLMRCHEYQDDDVNDPVRLW